MRTQRGLPKRDSKSFRKECATELIDMHYGRQRAGRPCEGNAARLYERHFSVPLGADNNCVVCLA